MQAATALVKTYTAADNAYLDDDRTKGIIITRASAIVNQWYASLSTKYQPAISPPSFNLTDEDKASLKSILVVTFGFASYEDKPIEEIGDGN